VIPNGLYELLVTRALQTALQSLPGRTAETSPPDDADYPVRLSRHLADEIARVLQDLPGGVSAQAGFANAILQFLRSHGSETPAEADIAAPEQLLWAVHGGKPPVRPETPLALSTLLARPGKPELGHEIAREIATADRVDALVSFVKWEGVRKLWWALKELSDAGRPLRLITTTYIGATEADAVRMIARLPNTQVRISLDGRRSRLHAKAWLFQRNTGFSTAYIGSANLSASALSGGLEWVMKVTEADLRHVIEMFRGAFDSLWNDPEFEPFDPERDYDRLQVALDAAHFGGKASAAPAPALFFTLRPYPFQQEILDDLAEQREYFGRRRNLIVAATGTGKTMIAAFDYARQSPAPRLLFLAHRRELLDQARCAFRQVLRDHAFGSLLTGDEKPESPHHLFATIPSLLRSGLLESLGPEHWPFVILDECHHLPAPSYREVMERLRPALLLGLTATPERADNQSLLPDFDGRIAAEIRLWHALERELVVPFEYYGLSDGTDLRAVRWSRGAYSADELDAAYTGDDRHAQLVAAQFARLRGRWPEARALGFCVSVRHAEFMAGAFRAAGIPAQAVHGGSPDAERDAAPGRLRRREVNVVFTCDLYNEGIDLPFVDTLLLLRPTSSATVFLQQLGRGLRLDEGKPTCLVLDFIGQHRREFRFDGLLTAMTGIPRGRLQKAVEEDFPSLPPGCHLHLDRVARDRVLASLRETIGGGPVKLAREIAQLAALAGGALPLARYLEESGRALEEVYAAGGWTFLRRQAGVLPAGVSEEERRWNARLGALCHIDEGPRLEATLRALRKPQDARSPVDERRLLMLAYQVFHHPDDLIMPATFLQRLAGQPELSAELVELLEILHGRAHPASTATPIAEWPLALHRRYGRREIQAAVGHWDAGRKPSSREGVLRLKEQQAELLFVTLDKSAKRFSPTTSYRDYAISPELFHWQSQAQAAEESEAGRRYVEQAKNGWRFFLFVRETIDDAYVFLGPVTYETHTGSRPMNVTWRLAQAMAPGLFERFATLLAA